MLRRNTLFASLLLAMAGCTVEPNRADWPDQYADAFCDWSRRCLSAVYFDTYDDPEECHDDVSDGVEEILDDLPGCDLDRRRAEDCLNRLNSSCRDSGGLDDVLRICLDVLDC